MRRLLARLTDRTRSHLRDAGDRQLFLAAADPARLAAPAPSRPLIADPIVRQQLVDGWATVSAAGDKPEYEDRVRQWLDIHAEHRVDDVLHVLVEACGSAYTQLAALLGVGNRWLRDNGDGELGAVRRHTVRRLNNAIDAARSGATTRHGERR